MELLETRDFQQHLRSLARRGGVAAVAHKQVVQAIKNWVKGDEPAWARVESSASVIPNVLFYDLAESHRLAAYESCGKRILLMVGTSDEVDQWCRENAGRDFTVNTFSDRVRFTPVDDETGLSVATPRQSERVVASEGSILARLPDALLQSLALSTTTRDLLLNSVTFEALVPGNAAEQITTKVAGLSFPTEEHRNVIRQVIYLLATGMDDEAAERVQLLTGRATTASANPAAFAKAVNSRQNSDYLLNLSKLGSDEIERYVGGVGLTDWMLFLHPEQRRLVERDFFGPARLIGVSGSGKTAVLVHRAHSLAKKYPDDRIMVLTLNPALSQLLSHLLDSLCTSTMRPRIIVQTIYEYCHLAVKTIAPQMVIQKHDPKSGENMADCWSDFLEKQHAATLILPVVNALEDRNERVNASAYLMDELVWIRSGFGKDNRNAYLTCDRRGRGIQLPLAESNGFNAKKVLGIPVDARFRILQLLTLYEQYMGDGGMRDDEGVSLLAFSLREKFQHHPELKARCVLVDEVQDCSTVELTVISQIPTERNNGLFLTGDPVQKIYAKQHDLPRAKIDILGRSHILKTNYRNTRQILIAAFTILNKYRDMSPVPVTDVVEPDYAFRDGPRPKLVECESTEQQLQTILSQIEGCSKEHQDAVCVCSPSIETLDVVAVALTERSIPHYRIHETSKGTLGKGVKLVSLSDIKGFEFSRVILVDLTDRFLLKDGIPRDERWRPAFQTYVAMTRARDELIMSFVFNRSILLAPLADTVDDLLAADVLGTPA
jgi:hypothetical protein